MILIGLYPILQSFFSDSTDTGPCMEVTKPSPVPTVLLCYVLAYQASQKALINQSVLKAP